MAEFAAEADKRCRFDIDTLFSIFTVHIKQPRCGLRTAAFVAVRPTLPRALPLSGMMLKWTKAYRRNAGKEMTVDSTLQFAQRRNEPVRYDRDLVNKTMAAIKRVSEIRARRERVFYKKRMAGKREKELAIARKLVAENEHLLPRLRGSEKKRLAELAAQGVEVAPEEELLSTRKNTVKAFGGEQRRLKVRVDGGVEEVVNTFRDEDGEEEEEEEEDDVDMED
ncbi:hypothetical protein TrVGV298_010217 [Trichoderma virens]|nr:hypothetical protein TrVGV298_010217 [Trichoderma virens]